MATFDKASSEKAAAALRAKRAEGAAKYKRDWLDSPTWDALAKARGVKLPQWHIAPTPGKLTAWLRQLTKQPMEELYGHRMTWAKLIELNPTMPLRAFVGQMLELAPLPCS